MSALTDRLAADAQAALEADPFSVWVYEIHDGVEVWRPAGFTPAEWEAHQTAALLGAAIATEIGDLQDWMGDLMGLFGLGDVFKDIAGIMDSITVELDP